MVTGNLSFLSKHDRFLIIESARQAVSDVSSLFLYSWGCGSNREDSCKLRVVLAGFRNIQVDDEENIVYSTLKTIKYLWQVCL